MDPMVDIPTWIHDPSQLFICQLSVYPKSIDTMVERDWNVYTLQVLLQNLPSKCWDVSFKDHFRVSCFPPLQQKINMYVGSDFKDFLLLAPNLGGK